MALAVTALALISICAACAAEPSITPKDGGAQVSSPNYSATITPDGGLTSVKAGETEFLDATNEFKRGAYFYQNGLLTLKMGKQQGNTLAAESEKASVTYQFGDADISMKVTNRTSEVMDFFLIFDASVKVVSVVKGQYVRTPVTNDWQAMSFFKDNAAVIASGATKLWGPWNGHQVFDVTLGGGASRDVKLVIAKTGADELKQVEAAAVPEAVREQDITVLSPRTWQVFQRASRYDGHILLSGRVRPQCDKLMARITGKSLKGDLPGKWQRVPLIRQTRAFASQLSVVPGGWYTVELKAMQDGKTVAQTRVEKVGVGEVFVGAGQSNSTNCGQEKINETSGMVSSFSGDFWQLANDPQPGPHDKTQGGSFWPAFGDAMYARYQVPIGVAVTGHGGTSVSQWQPDDPLGLFPWMMERIYQLGPMGFRAALWHQGETDAVTPTDIYVQKMTNVIRTSTYRANWQFPWFVAHASYHNEQNPSWPLARAAQSELWRTGIALEGPDTDLLTGDNRDFEGKGIHFSPKGLRAHGKMWAEKVGVYLDKVLGPQPKGD